jgi:hypothetical protein
VKTFKFAPTKEAAAFMRKMGITSMGSGNIRIVLPKESKKKKPLPKGKKTEKAK